MKRIFGKAAKKIAPGVLENIARLDDMDKRLAQIQSELTAITESHMSSFEKLRKLASQVEPYQPAYGLSGVIAGPLRSCNERARTIENWLQPVAGKRLLDIGSSLGYFSFYFADRGASVQGWESNPMNAEVARSISQMNGIAVDFQTKEFNQQSVHTIPTGQYDAALVLSVFHHIIRFKGLSYTQQLVKDLFDYVPILIVELAKKGEDPKLPWDKSQPEHELDIFELVKNDVAIKKIGEFSNHLSKKKRPLYVVEKKKHIKVNSHHYIYANLVKEAYKNSPVAYMAVGRRYYFGANFIIKEYLMDKHSRSENLSQILNEIRIFNDIKTKGLKVFHAPSLLDFEIDYLKRVRIVLERTEGQLASDLLVPLKTSQSIRVIKDILHTLIDLEKLKLHHNDVRSWNIIIDPSGRGWLIDYGLAGPLIIDDDVKALLWVWHSLITGEREAAEQQKNALPPVKTFKDIPKLHAFYGAVRSGERSLQTLYRLL